MEVLELTLSKLNRSWVWGFTVGILVSDMDFVTALCSQVVYEGLVDDTFRIKCGKCCDPLHLAKVEMTPASGNSHSRAVLVGETGDDRRPLAEVRNE